MKVRLAVVLVVAAVACGPRPDGTTASEASIPQCAQAPCEGWRHIPELLRHDVPSGAPQGPVAIRVLINPGVQLPLQLVMYYRPFGETAFRAMPMVASEGGHAVELPCAIPEPSGWEYVFVAWAPDSHAGEATILQGLDAGGPVEPWQRPLDQPYRVQFAPRTDGAPGMCADAVPMADLPDDPAAMPLDDFHCSIEGLPRPPCPLPQ